MVHHLETEQTRQGAGSVHAVRGEELPQDQVRLYPILARVFTLDPSDAGYRSLLKFHAGRIQNRGNLKRSARRCNIPDALSLSIQEICYRLKACLSRCKYFRKNGYYYQRKHLYSRLEVAKEKEDEEAARQILTIIQREKDKQFWQRMTYDLGKPRGGACFRVQVEQGDGMTEEYTGQEEMQEAIWDNIHRKRFNLAESAPPPYAKNHCMGPSDIMPSVKLHKRFSTECMNTPQNLMKPPRRSFKSVRLSA
jgi:hypothetical protein